MKRIISLFLVAVMVVAFTACGSESSNANAAVPEGQSAIVAAIDRVAPSSDSSAIKTNPEQATQAETPTQPVHQHDYIKTTVKNPSCTEAGSTTWTCNCGDSYDEMIAVLDHVYTEQTTQEVTCTTDGVKTYLCSACNYSYIASIPALGHDYSISVKNTEVTCTTDGVTEKQCSRCDDVLKTTTAAMGHSTSAGICSRCKTFISDGFSITTKNTSLTITGSTDIKFTVPGTDFSIICDYNSAYIDISWGNFVGDDIILTVKPLKSGSTSIKVYIEEDPSVYIDVDIKITLPTTAGTSTPSTSNTKSYVLNTNTKKFHYPSCRSVNQMKESNKRHYTGTRQSVINMGYSPCGNCHP